MRPALVLVLGAALLTGCRAMPEVVGVVSGALAGGATGNPAVGYAVGVTADAAADAGIKYYGRVRQHAEQDEIAAAAGALPPGGHATWRIRHTIPTGNEHGELLVTASIDTPLTACKEIAFSVADGASQHWYDANICRQGDHWKWATAEPAVERWGNLQ